MSAAGEKWGKRQRCQHGADSKQVWNSRREACLASSQNPEQREAGGRGRQHATAPRCTLSVKFPPPHTHHAAASHTRTGAGESQGPRSPDSSSAGKGHWEHYWGVLSPPLCWLPHKRTCTQRTLRQSTADSTFLKKTNFREWEDLSFSPISATFREDTWLRFLYP